MFDTMGWVEAGGKWAGQVRSGTVPYAELHCHSNFSFLDGASSPAELVQEAYRLGLEAIAITDHDGLYGAVQLAGAASTLGVRTIFGAELTLGLGPEGAGSRSGTNGRPKHLTVLAKGPNGYASLSKAVAEAHLRGGQKGRPVYDMAALSSAAKGNWTVLSGCRQGAVASALEAEGPVAAARELLVLVEAFGRENVFVELWDHGLPIDCARNDALAAVALGVGVEPVATNNVHYATPHQSRLAAALAAVAARTSLEEHDRRLAPSAAAHLRSGGEQQRRFARWPGVVARTVEISKMCAFDLRLVAPRLPDFPVPGGHDEMSWLIRLTEDGATPRYGPRDGEVVKGAWSQIDHELEVIARLGFAGYFLIVWDIVQFCKGHDIYCQGRGSAANSAVCYALGITNADAVSLGLLFERFLSPERDGPPDIDVDIESGRREEVIAYVYSRYGRLRAAQVANVITYRARSAVRDAGKALGYPQGSLDAWSKQLEWRTPLAKVFSHPDEAGGAHNIPTAVIELAAQMEGLPRHLGIHSGGMVICDRPVVEVCPVEWGRMPGRSVLQWDKEDCAAAGLVKFDLLGLGMLSALHGMVDTVAAAEGIEVDLATIPQDDAVYQMLSAGDSVGVFQVESRAQMATLPRLRPRCFYDLVIEVALIRPGPIQGGSVHPYIRRRNGREPVTYLHPLLESSLAKTLGIPLFQEQLMQMAVDVAGFSPAESDQLRQAMGAKRSPERMEHMRRRFYDGMAERRITGEVADAIWDKLAAFASFGFPESHSVSFAYLVYSSAWFKLHHPEAFLVGLLNAQPMGFWSPNSLIADAMRHGVTVVSPHVNRSGALAQLERRKDRSLCVRVGLISVRSMSSEMAGRIESLRPYESIEDLARRAMPTKSQLEALATAGALEGLAASGIPHPPRPDATEGSPEGRSGRREALWAAGALAHQGPDRLEGISPGVVSPRLPGMSDLEIVAADLWSTGVSTHAHPISFLREHLTRRGAIPAAQVFGVTAQRVCVAGVVTHRQRPGTAKGTVFVNLEDETGLLNVIFSKGAWARWRRVSRSARVLMVWGRLERADGVANVVAERVEGVPMELASPSSRDFR